MQQAPELESLNGGTTSPDHTDNPAIRTTNQWSNFQPPREISTNHSWTTRHHHSSILKDNSGPAGVSAISTLDTEVYGNPNHPLLFRIGNGGAGYTGLLQTLSEEFIRTHGDDFRIGWVSNHSRHSQIALLADVVQVALTYEPEVEELAVSEGWCRRVQKPAFWDHFIIVGPRDNPAGLKPGCGSSEALKRIAARGGLFHTRGDGSATFSKEQRLWKTANINTSDAAWMETHPVPPYQALRKASQDSAYLLTDRATFLTAKQHRIAHDLAVFVEGEKEFLNPCSALINTKVPGSPAQRTAVEFAEWLGGETAQSMIIDYGRKWQQGMALFTPTIKEDFDEADNLAGNEM